MRDEKILLVGNCIIDEVLTLSCFPDEDDEIRAKDRYRSLGGNACNSAQILAQLGHEVSLLSSLAGDDGGRWIREQLTSAGISFDLCTTHAHSSTPVSSIWLNQANGSRTIVHHRQLPELSLSALRRIDPQQYRWIHLEGRNIDSLAEIVPRLADFKVPMSLEIEKPRQGIEQLCAFVDTIIVSTHYARSRNISIESCMQEIRQINPVARVVCTRGKNGLTAIDERGKLLEFGAEPVHRVVDTIGAGDSFIAALISASLQRTDFSTALEFARRIAARKIQHKGMTLN